MLTILRSAPQQHLPEPEHGIVVAIVLCVLTSVTRMERGHLLYRGWILSVMAPIGKAFLCDCGVFLGLLQEHRKQSYKVGILKSNED